MINFLRKTKNYWQDYLDISKKSNSINLKANKIITTIQEAQSKNLALHAIYNNTSFTGDLVRYDKEQGKIILKNFKKNISTIILLDDIDKLSLVPPTIRTSQLPTQKRTRSF